LRHVEVLARIGSLNSLQTYAVISDFARYPDYSEAVRSVNIANTADGRSISDWEVNFREGILRWKEEDVFHPDECIVRFRQIEGDVEYFVGEWSIWDDRRGCLVRFACDFDMGIPGLSDMLEPIAEQALRDNIRSILAGLIPSAEFLPNGADGHGGEG
jgi:ribosome-associated toxin RatA of RatAB toxin-antitoxin module